MRIRLRDRQQECGLKTRVREHSRIVTVARDARFSVRKIATGSKRRWDGGCSGHGAAVLATLCLYASDDQYSWSVAEVIVQGSRYYEHT